MEPEAKFMLFGWVKLILRRGKDQISFVVHSPKSNRDTTCIYSGFLPLSENDTISAVCQWSGASLAVIVAPPFIEMPTDRTSVEASFMLAFNKKLSNSKASALFNQLTQHSGASRDVAQYVTGLSLEWSEKNELRLIEPFKGILTSSEAMQLLRWWYKKREVRRLYLLGMNNREIAGCHIRVDKIFNDAVTNPYKLLGISLDKATEICNRVGLKLAPEMVECGMMLRWIRDKVVEKCSMCLFQEEVVLSLPRFVPLYPLMERDFGVTIDMNCVYLQRDLHMEIVVASRISKLQAKEQEENEITEQDRVGEIQKLAERTDTLELSSKSKTTENEITEQGGVGEIEIQKLTEQDESPEFSGKSKMVEKKLVKLKVREQDIDFVNPNLDASQKQAVVDALSSSFCLVTGAAGTGKTTVIDELAQQLTKRGKKWMLVSLTGKAVSRIREMITINKTTPRTIHRLIYSTRTYQEDADDKSTPVFDHLIVDEVSMVTISLLFRVFSTFMNDFDITLVGDHNQLPPIERGPLLYTLLDANVNRANLSVNHRILNNKDECGILLNATSLISTPVGQFAFHNTKNFHVDIGDIEVVYGMVKLFYQNGTKPTDVTVLSPYNKDVDAINSFCQEVFNEGYQYVTDEKGKKWRVGDRVIMTVNNYDIDVMNGDEGTITGFDFSSVDVRFRDDKMVNFKLRSIPDGKKEAKVPDPDFGFEAASDELVTENLALSYALTAHKSQASEWPHVIFFAREGGNFINRNMIYTSITRARRSCWVVISNPRSFSNSLANVFSCPINNLSKRITK